jgi:hypothetical protein
MVNSNGSRPGTQPDCRLLLRRHQQSDADALEQPDDLRARAGRNVLTPAWMSWATWTFSRTVRVKFAFMSARYVGEMRG